MCAAAGCHLRPTAEESEELVAATSTETYRIAMAHPTTQPFAKRRAWQRQIAYMARGTIVHPPSYYEDPFEDHGSQDGTFQWTWEDLLAWPYSNGRWLIDTWFLPLTVVVEPPWKLKHSDGRVGTKPFREHDASRDPANDADEAAVEWQSLYENQPTGQDRQ